MANSTVIQAASQTTTAKSDWLAFLGSAFIDGLKAYGAALMMAAPEPTLTLPKAPSHPMALKADTISVGAPEPLPLGTGDIDSKEHKPAFRQQPVVTTLTKQAWTRA